MMNQKTDAIGVIDSGIGGFSVARRVQELLPQENILYLGIPLVQRAVFDGSWKAIKKQKIWRNHP